MARENAFTKGRRLLCEGRLRLVAVHGQHVDARCRGDSAAEYRVRHLPGTGWGCTCDAVGRCSHVIAAQLVTVVRDEEARR